MGKIAIMLLAISLPALSKNWEAMEVPGARCGNGSPYKIFVRKGHPQKLAMGFQGGGACWSYMTCFGPTPLTSLYPPKEVIYRGGLLSLDPERSALAAYTHVFFGYCTGDAYLANHTGKYSFGKKAHHEGQANIAKSLKFLKEKGIVGWDFLTHVTLYGFSAGAIGALVHIPTVEPYLTKSARRSVISDSPGLHFGKKFWHKFTDELLRDFKTQFAKLGLILDKNTGNVAPQIPNLCRKFSNWNIGILQSTRDFVMTVIFGNISQRSHKKLVIGPKGIYQSTLHPNDNCSTWIPDTTVHTFLSYDDNADIETNGKKAIDYANDLIDESDLSSYKFPED